MKELLTTDIRFYDGQGHFKEEQFVSENMNQLEANADLLAESLEKSWGHSVHWKKIDHSDKEEIVVKVTLLKGQEQAFRDFANEKGWFFQEVRYTKQLIRWRVDLRNEVERTLLEQQSFVDSVQDMPVVTADFMS